MVDFVVFDINRLLIDFYDLLIDFFDLLIELYNLYIYLLIKMDQFYIEIAIVDSISLPDSIEIVATIQIQIRFDDNDSIRYP